jgi:predicted transcriptional regulator
MRWFIYRGMRSGIKDEGDRTRTVTLHIDKDPFKTALKIDSEASIVVVVVDAKGKLVGRSEGAFGEEKWEKLVSVLDGK